MKKAFINIALWLLCLFTASAEEPRPVGLDVYVPATGKLDAPIRIRVSNHGQADTVSLKAIPFHEVTKEAKASSVNTPAIVALKQGEGAFDLKVSNPGEYHLVLDNGQDPVQIAIIAKGKTVWLGQGTVGTLLQTRLLKEVEAESETEAEAKKEFETRYRKLLDARAEKAGRTSATGREKALAVGDISSGDTLFFKCQWEAPKPADPKDPAVPADLTMFNSFGMDGVKVQVRNAANNALVTETYLVNGVCSFTAPADSFNPKITLVASFPGITASGGIKTAGGGIGSFDTEDGAGNTYTYDIPTPLDFLGKTDATAVNFVFNRTAARGGDNLAQMWACFHCVADMVRELKTTMGQDKASNFKVHFPQPGTTSFFGSDKKLHITGVRSYVWDVIGHEFGHMVQDDTTSINSQGGSHNGSNQYDYDPNVDDPMTPAVEHISTFQNKLRSNRLSLNEGYGSWIGVAFTERSSRFKGNVKWVGDKLYRDWINLEENSPKFSFGAAVYKGEDTELAVQALLWDLHDANGDTYAATGLKDSTALGMKFMFDKFKNKSMDSIFDVWRHLFVPSGDMTNFTKASGIDGAALGTALKAAITFAELGVAPHLANPKAGEKIDLTATSGPKIQWKQYATGNAAMDLNRFQIILYSSDLTERLWTSAEFTAGTAPLTTLATRSWEYELVEADIMAIKAATMNRTDASAVLAILARNAANGANHPETGLYLSNGVEVLLQDYNRAMVAVVDSSGSNTTTDPTDQRVVASKESLRRLVSTADVMADPTLVPDIAASIDFDSGVSVLSNFADPDAVIPTLDLIDSSGGTSIDGGINAGIGLLDNITQNQNITGLFNNRAALLVFTDGQNNSGDGPVIAAILNATAKGYRVHYGFLSPLVSPALKSMDSVSGPGDPPPPPKVVKEGRDKTNNPTTIEEAVLCSGGVFAQIGDAQSQIAFVEQVFSRGLTNIDGDGSSGGLLVGQANTADQLTPENDIKSYTFTGQQNEDVSVRVETVNFQPNVTVYDRDGNILAVGIAPVGQTSLTLNLPPLPYSGEYTVQLYAEDGNTGLYNIFIDVQNIIANVPIIASASDLTLNVQTGSFEQTIVVQNSTGGIVQGFQIDVSSLPTGAIVLSAPEGSTSVSFTGTLADGESVELVLEYFSPDRTPFTPVLTVAANTSAPPPVFTSGVSAGGFLAADGSFVVEFASVPGTLYYVQYSDDGANWTTVLPAIDARGTAVQWIDSGPPKTSAHPSQVAVRLYRVAQP